MDWVNFDHAFSVPLVRLLQRQAASYGLNRAAPPESGDQASSAAFKIIKKAVRFRTAMTRILATGEHHPVSTRI